jgi:hypothetical protein
MISYLTTEPTENKLDFIVSNLVDEISIDIPSTVQLEFGRYESEFGVWNSSQFQRGDNVIIRGIQIILPYRFTLGEMNNSVILATEFFDVGGQTERAPNYQLTTSNEYQEQEVYLKYGNPVENEDFFITVKTTSISISMKNVPVDMVGNTYFAGIGIKVEHTLGLIQ